MNYLDDYLTYSSENEASQKFHRWGALICLSVAVTRRIWVQQGDWRVFPSLYLAFVGDPASGKTIAMGYAQRLVQDFTDIPIGPKAITKEALTQFMAKECQMHYIVDGQRFDYSPIVLFSSEFVTLLGGDNSTKMIEFFTDAYDGDDFDVYTKNKGTDIIKKPCVILHVCITPDTLSSMTAANLVSGGFARRMNFVYGRARGSPKPRPEFGEKQRAAKHRCIEYCKQLQKLAGPMSWGEGATTWFDDWYINKKDKDMRQATNPIMRRYHSAKDVLLLKIATLLSLAEAPELVLRKSALERGLVWLEELEKDLLIVLGGGGRNDLAPLTLQIERFVNESPKGVTRKLLLAQFMQDARDEEIDSVLQHLVETESIKLVQQVNAATGKNFDVYLPRQQSS